MSLGDLTFKDKVLPVQPEQRKCFDGDDLSLVTALYNATSLFSELRLPAEDFDIEVSEKFSIPEMGSNPIQLRFLQSLVLMKRPQRILEIGTFIGVSAMYMAKVLPENGRIVTVEKYDHFARIARANFAKNGLADKVQLVEGDAFEELREPNLDWRFDMIFLDGNKERYPEYFTLLDPLLALGGLFVVDDVFFHGDVLNQEPKSDKGIGVRKFLEIVRTNQDYHKTILPIGNGIMLMVKRGRM